jgi:AcrR family transcriptional regulator
MSTPVAARPGRRRDESLTRAILEATLALLREQGYDGLSIEAIARRAGVSRPTIYKRWRSLSDLALDAARLTPDLGRAFPEGLIPVPDTGSLRGDLLAIARDGVALLRSLDERGILTGLFAGIVADPALGPVFRSGFLDRDAERLHAVFERARRRGELRDGVDPSIGLEMLVAFGFHRIVIVRDSLEESVFERAVDVLVAGLTNAGDGSPDGAIPA